MIIRKNTISIVAILVAILVFMPLSGSAQAISRNKKKATTTTTTKKKSATSNTTTTKSKQSTSKQSSASTHKQNIPAVVQKAIDDMVWVEGGTFMMGATSEQGSDAEDDEKPVHQVALTGYYIGRYEVTQELWLAVMGSNPSLYKGDLQRPVDHVSWEDCQEFISKLNRLSGKRFRMLSEAEWEYAARGGSQSRRYKYSGSNNIDDVAWYSDNRGENTTHPVGQKAPNELGLYDMSGNVSELCHDWYSFDYSKERNPGYHRVNRGGCIYSPASVCRVSNRGLYPTKGHGLRLAASSL